MKNKLYSVVVVLGLLFIACARLPESADEESPLQWYERNLQYADDAFSGSYKAFMAIQPHIPDGDWESLLRELTISERVVDHLEALVARLEAPLSGIVVQAETLEAFRDAHVRLSTWVDAGAGMDGWGEGTTAIQTGRCFLIKHAPAGIERELPEVCN